MRFRPREEPFARCSLGRHISPAQPSGRVVESACDRLSSSQAPIRAVVVQGLASRVLHIRETRGDAGSVDSCGQYPPVLAVLKSH